jgi:hypothetical protein
MATPRGPFPDNPKAPAKAGCRLEPPPELGAIATARRPFGIEPGEMRLKNVRAAAEYIAPAAAHNIAHQFAAAPRPTHDLLDRRAGFGQGTDEVMGFLSPQIAFVLQALGMMVALPSAMRIGRIDRRTASRKAALAFSIRCQRSATCTACGAALVAAWPYPPPRSREMTVISGWRDSQTSTVAGSRSGRRSTTQRRSRSQMILP